MSGTIEYAGFWRRAAAALADLTLLSMLVAVLQLAIGFQTIGFVLQFVIGLVFCVVFWVHYGGTPGKMLLGCQVVNANTYEHLNYQQAVLRYTGYYVSFLTMYLGFLWVLWDAKKQGFHDKIANSVVLYNAETDRDDESQKTLQQLISELR